MTGHWWESAACATLGHDYLTMTTPRQKTICADCPVRSACLDEALALEAREGVGIGWPVRGGLDGPQRAAILSAQRSGRTPAPIRHGTIGGYSTHRRRGETPCWDCAEAVRGYDRGRRMAAAR